MIGTKHAPATVRAFRENESALDELHAVSGLPIKLIHVVRNPFDNIASMTPSDRQRLR